MHTTWISHHKPLCILLAFVLLLIIFAVSEILYVILDGTPVPVPTIPRDTQTLGAGSALTYVILGDSTAVAQGASYDQGYSVDSAHHLAEHYTVHWTNYAISGARAHDVLTKQLPEALAQKPDLVLIAVGANDITHLTDPTRVTNDLQKCITALRSINPKVDIVLTGAPAMGTIPRFPQPIRWYAGVRTGQLNTQIVRLTEQTNTTFAPVADKTGAIFRAHPEYFARDQFHPNAQGYQVWKPVITAALDTAIASSRSQ